MKDEELQNEDEKQAYHITRKLFWILFLGMVVYCGAMGFVLTTTHGNM